MVTPPGYSPSAPPALVPPPRGLALTGGILALLGGLGHALVGFLLLLLAAFMAAVVESMFGRVPDDSSARAEVAAVFAILLTYTGLCVLSAVIAIWAMLARFWAVLCTAIFQGLLALGLLYLTVRSGDWFVGAVASYSVVTTTFCVLGLRQARAHGDYLRLIRQGGPPPPPGQGYPYGPPAA